MLNYRECRVKVTDYIVGELIRRKIDTVFGYTGGSIADLIDSIGRSADIRFIQSYNEQASALSANAYAQLTGKTGVAISSSGPGAINLLNGVANAYYDSIPCVFITGNVHSLSRKESDKIRQNAFQETDIVDIAKSITKYCVQIGRAEEIIYQLSKAFFIANSGRKGPVLIDIPYDIQRAFITVDQVEEQVFPELTYEDCDFSKLNELLSNARRPLMLVGGGSLDAREEICQLLKKYPIPVVASLRGIDIVPHDNPNYIGFIGSYGNRYANLAAEYCDLLIVLGSRLDERQKGYRPNEFAPHARIVQVDIDDVELGRKTENTMSVLLPVKSFVQKLLTRSFPNPFDDWVELLRDWKRRYPSEQDVDTVLNANNFCRRLSDFLQKDAIITADVGQNQMVSAQSLRLRENRRFLSSAGLGCMGYSVPAAIGAYYAFPDRQIISINGDGGVQMNIQELQTIARERLPIKILIFNNRCLGLIRKLQENLFEKRYFASVDGFSAPDFKQIADAYGMQYFQIRTTEDYDGLPGVLASPCAALIDVIFPTEMQTNPEPGKTISMQEPPLSESDLKIIQRQIKELV